MMRLQTYKLPAVLAFVTLFPVGAHANCADLLALRGIADHAEAITATTDGETIRTHATALQAELAQISVTQTEQTLASLYRSAGRGWVEQMLDQLATLADAGIASAPGDIGDIANDPGFIIAMSRLRLSASRVDCVQNGALNLLRSTPTDAEIMQLGPMARHLSVDHPIFGRDEQQIDLGVTSRIAPLGPFVVGLRALFRDHATRNIAVALSLVLLLALAGTTRAIRAARKRRSEPRQVCMCLCLVQPRSRFRAFPPKPATNFVADPDATTEPDNERGYTADAETAERALVLNVNKYGLCITQPATAITDKDISVLIAGTWHQAHVKWSNARCLGLHLAEQLSDEQVASIVARTPQDDPRTATGDTSSLPVINNEKWRPA